MPLWLVSEKQQVPIKTHFLSAFCHKISFDCPLNQGEYYYFLFKVSRKQLSCPCALGELLSKYRVIAIYFLFFINLIFSDCNFLIQYWIIAIILASFCFKLNPKSIRLCPLTTRVLEDGNESSPTFHQQSIESFWAWNMYKCYSDTWLNIVFFGFNSSSFLLKYCQRHRV